MRIIVILTMMLFCGLHAFASFPVDNRSSDPTTDSWNLIIIVFWLLVIAIPIVLIRLIKKLLQRNKENNS